CEKQGGFNSHFSHTGVVVYADKSMGAPISPKSEISQLVMKFAFYTCALLSNFFYLIYLKSIICVNYR
ncbi:MAG TPA: hypothetical protein VK174_07310, partial [Chitinophagales bacterium]|nr:hypothetical protein [Chitinophagales bacterium]